MAQNYAIRYIEPLAQNLPALGLDIAFEVNRREAADQARDTGAATITKRIFLVQDNIERAGFLLLRPLYSSNQSIGTLEKRREAFLGWVYAPFVGVRFLSNLTESQGATIDISVFDGDTTAPDQLIFSSQSASALDLKSPHFVQKTVEVMGQTWTIVWTSTPQFDASLTNNEPLLVLAAGLLITILFAAYMASFSRREQTIRRTVEQKTRELVAREQENAAVVNTAVVGIMLFDTDGRLLSANSSALKTFNLEPQENYGLRIDDLIELDEGTGSQEFMQSVAPGGGLATTVTRGLTHGGESLDLEFQVNSWTTEDGQQRFTAIVRDVTTEREITNALELAEQRWSSALRGSSIGVFDVDLQTGTSIVSDTWKEMLGFAATDTIDAQLEWLERVHPDDISRVRKADEECLSGRAPHSQTEYRIRHKQGHWIWLRSDATVTSRDVSGQALRLVGTQTDITGIKEAEASLRFSEERLRTAIDNAPIGMALLNESGHWLKVNDALCAFLGYDEHELLGLDFQTITYPDDLAADLDLVRQLTSGEISTYQLEKRYLHKNGYPVWGLLSASIARNSNGEFDYFIAQIQDIQLRKEMDRLKSEFISNVSHELRTPLTSIRGSLGLVTGAMATGIPEGVMRLLTIAHKNSERLILLINDILDLEKISADKIVFDIKPHDLNEELSLAIESNHAFADQFGVRFEYRGDQSPIMAQFDAARLQQVLSNLMSNAAKFSPRDGVVVVDVDVALRPGFARLSVTDNGPGIPRSFRNQIFSPFSQGDASATREKGGTGLGLHIAKQMMEKMSGNLDYVSEEGAGSTFWIDIPLAAETALNVPSSNSGNDLPKVLHVEDDADFRTFISAALDGKLQLSQAGSLAEARALVAEQTFDLVILDLHLPDGDGLELLDALHDSSGSEQDGTESPVVLLTASEYNATDPRVRLSIVKSRASEETIIRQILEVAGVDTAPRVKRVG